MTDGRGGSDDDLEELLRRASGYADRNDDERWEVVAALHCRADRLAFDAACHLVEADNGADRVLGLDILGQIGVLANRPFLEETLPVLIAASADNRTDVLAAAIGALGHVGDP